MHHVRAIQRHTNVRRIFLATENASVIAEAMSRYPEFEWRVARDSASLALERSALNYHMADFVRDHPSQAALVRTASHSKHRCKALRVRTRLSQRTGSGPRLVDLATSAPGLAQVWAWIGGQRHR